MITKQIWLLPKEQRLAAFLDRYLELDEFTGNRTFEEKAEMAEIADAMLPAMIRFVTNSRSLVERWQPLARSTAEEMQSFSEGHHGPVQAADTYNLCRTELQQLLDKLEGKS